MEEDKQRYERERSFHNWVNAEQGRSSVRKFYSISDVVNRCYRERILACGGHDVLEIGCGRYPVASFLSTDISFTAIDISDVAVQETAEVARSKGIEGAYLLMNAEETAFADNSFDLICGTSILHHLNLKLACAEIRRILRPNGSAVFIEPLGHNPFINLYRKLTPRIRSVDEHPLLLKDMEDIRSQFEQVELHYFCCLSLAAVPFRNWKIFPAVKDALQRIDSSIFRALPVSRRYAWMMVMIMSGAKGGAQ
jgi:ubiquinone/menaquinone biosynthesis C-methylase UbiE